jgi:hypothetical protein
MSWTEDIDLVDRLADVLLRRRGYTLDARPGADFLARADGEQIDEARDDARAVLVAVGPHIAAQALRDAAVALRATGPTAPALLAARAETIEKEAGR